MFDATALQKALTPPALRADVPRTRWWERALVAVRLLPATAQRTYVGRILSHAEFSAFSERFRIVEEGRATDHQAEALAREYVALIGLPVDVYDALPPAVRAEALADFLARQTRAIVPSVVRMRAAMNGIGSTPGDGTASGSMPSARAARGMG